MLDQIPPRPANSPLAGCCMTGYPTAVPSSVSVVIAAFNEKDSLAVLIPELQSVLQDLGRSCEIIVVDDGSTDATDELFASLQQHPGVTTRCIRQEKHQGKTAAWIRGFEAASGDLICTMDGDLQNDPRDIPRLIAKLETESHDLVSGWRRHRRASLLFRVIPSKMANWLVRVLFQTRLHDLGCGLKVFRKEVCASILLHECTHRFLPLLVEQQGKKTCEIETNDRQRAHGQSKYGLLRALTVPFDLLRLRSSLRSRARAGSAEPGALFSLILVGVLTLTGLVIRRLGLGDDSFSGDEVISFHCISRPWSEIPGFMAAESVHPPLYFVLLHFWTRIVGVSEQAARAPSAIFGALSIPLAAALATVVFNKKTGLFAALLLAISPFHVYYSQDARPYSLFGLLILWSLWAYHRMIKAASRKVILEYLLASTLLLYTHVFSLFTIAGQNIHFLLSKKGSRGSGGLTLQQWLVAQATLAVLFLPWLHSLMNQIEHRQGRWDWIPEPTWHSLSDTFFSYGCYSRLLTLSVGLFALVGLVPWTLRVPLRRWLEGQGSVLLWLAAPLLLPFLVSKIYVPVYDPRYTIQGFLALVVLAAAGLGCIGGPRLLRLLVVLLAVVPSMPGLWAVVTLQHKVPWREITSHVEQRADGLDLVLVGPSSNQLVLGFYAKRPLARMGLPGFLWQYNDPRWTPSLPPEALAEIRGRRRVWLIIRSLICGASCSRAVEDQVRSFGASLMPGHRLTNVRIFGFMAVAPFEKVQPAKTGTRGPAVYKMSR